MAINTHTTKTCKKCGKEFNPHYGLDNQNFCSMECYLGDRWGERKPQFCQHCGSEFHNKNRQAKYCSQSCSQKASVGSKKPHKSGKDTHPCAWCGKDVIRQHSAAKIRKKAFCSVACMAEWQSKFVTGESHPRWKGKPVGPGGYGLAWKPAREAAIQRAQGKCQKCKSETKLDVHHILPVRYFEIIEDAHKPSNLIALCKRCHAKEHKKLADALPLLDMLRHHSSQK